MKTISAGELGAVPTTDNDNSDVVAMVKTLHIHTRSKLFELVSSLSSDPFSSKYRSLQDLTFFGKIRIDNRAATILGEGLRSLKTLTFAKFTLCDDAGAFIASFKLSTTLQRLRLFWCTFIYKQHQIPKAKLMIISMLANNKSLTALHIIVGSGHMNFSTEEIANALCFHPTLETLNICSFSPGENSIAAVAKLIAENNVLKEITLGGRVVTEEEIGMLRNPLIRNQTLTHFSCVHSLEPFGDSADSYNEMRSKVLQANLTLTVFDNITFDLCSNSDDCWGAIAEEALRRNKHIANSFVASGISDGLLPFLLAPSNSSFQRVSEFHFFLCSRLDLVVAALSCRNTTASRSTLTTDDPN